MYVLGSKEPCKEWGSAWLIHTVDTGPEEMKTGRKEEWGKGEGKEEGGREERMKERKRR
jgi:hypothetical protein